ncbi:MAG TPA: polymorphic toxin type 44 domain-containing protein [Limnobacter sp.]|nr:polymorphic toxin type 44 domain-containing protein [Limnobacter sp.]
MIVLKTGRAICLIASRLFVIVTESNCSSISGFMVFKSYCQAFATQLVANTNSVKAKNIRALLSSPTTYANRLWSWKDAVGAGREWDYKRSIRAQHGIWITDPDTKTEYNSDVWGNLNYGFVGLSVGISEGLLLSAAGAAQVIDTGVAKGFGTRCLDGGLHRACLPSLDDPVDQEAIRLGIQMWKEIGSQLTWQHLIQLLRSKRSMLNTRRAR